MLFIDRFASNRPRNIDSPMALRPSLSQTEPDRDEAAVARYIASMSGDLARLARNSGFQTLGYLLEIAQLEAEQVAPPQSRR